MSAFLVLQPNLPRGQIINFRLGTDLRPQYKTAFCLDEIGYLTLRIVEIAENPCFGRTRLYAGGFSSFGSPVNAEIALGGHADAAFLLPEMLGMLLIRAEREPLREIASPLIYLIPRAIGATHYTVCATDALVLVYSDDSVICLIGRSGGADFHAIRFFAMIAKHRQRLPNRIWEYTRFASQNPSPEHSGRCPVRHFACHRTGVATVASLEVNDHSVTCHIQLQSKLTSASSDALTGLRLSLCLVNFRAATDILV